MRSHAEVNQPLKYLQNKFNGSWLRIWSGWVGWDKVCHSTHPDQSHNHSILSRDRKCAPVEVNLPGPPFKEGFSCKKCGKLTASNCWHLQGLRFHFCAEAPNVRRQPSATMAHGRDTRVCSFLPDTGLLQWPSLSRELPFGFSKTLSDLRCSLRLPLLHPASPTFPFTDVRSALVSECFPCPILFLPACVCYRHYPSTP